jgi:hypothetical protein
VPRVCKAVVVYDEFNHRVLVRIWGVERQWEVSHIERQTISVTDDTDTTHIGFRSDDFDAIVDYRHLLVDSSELDVNSIAYVLFVVNRFFGIIFRLFEMHFELVFIVNLPLIVKPS